MIPRHYAVSNPTQRLRGYIGVYLNEEIREEALARNLSTFARFLEVAAQCDGEVLVYKNVAQDCGIDHRTVKEYFGIFRALKSGVAKEFYQHLKNDGLLPLRQLDKREFASKKWNILRLLFNCPALTCGIGKIYGFIR